LPGRSVDSSGLIPLHFALARFVRLPPGNLILALPPTSVRFLTRPGDCDIQGAA
jgi:hypothetical protein